MRLGRNGEIIAETGFDGGSYTPRYESRTSVYLGDMSKEDMRIKAEVDARNRAIRQENIKAQAIKLMREREKYLIQDRIRQRLQEREERSNRMMEFARARGFENAKFSGRMMDTNPWIGSPLAGFGQEGEQRINPDSAADVEIVDASIPSVKEYGLNNWMEDPDSIVERVAANSAAYTDGKIQLATLVDYAKSPDRSVVGMPLASELSQNLQAAEAVVDQAVQETPKPILKYALYGLAALWLLRR